MSTTIMGCVKLTVNGVVISYHVVYIQVQYTGIQRQIIKFNAYVYLTLNSISVNRAVSFFIKIEN